MIGIVRDVDAFAHSVNAKRIWRPTLFHENGSAKAWASEGIVIVSTKNGAGLLSFKIRFRNHAESYQSTLAEAEEFAEAQDDRNRP